ncbi:uncharacterized protein [Fopius arisanus]|uniref:Uncharacterized protein n=1 Tax=Fopius arisanus TaxID=64838 RepID=A0A9R1UAD4_9HYME|nr:PREDICTED: uncharacterized protein LOC105272533 [Fopius arisanus]
MTSSTIEMTSDAEIDGFEPGDASMELIGYVETIEGMREIRSPQKHLFKFIINNGNDKRMRVLMWAKEALKYLPQITLKQIVSLTMGTISAVNPKFKGSYENMADTEFNVQTTSDVTFHGVYGETAQCFLSYEEVPLQRVSTMTMPMCIEAFLRSPFKLVSTINGSYGAGLVVDPNYKLAVQITNFKDNENLTQGVCLKLKGQMAKNKMGGQFFKVSDMGNENVVEGNDSG